MRIERLHLTGVTDVPTRARNTTPGGKSDANDTVSLRFAAEVDRTVSIDGDSYDPAPIDVARVLIEKGFDR